MAFLVGVPRVSTLCRHPPSHVVDPLGRHRPLRLLSASPPWSPLLMPDIGALLWPRSVALIGASSDAEGLRGRILKVMQSHPYKGAFYPVSRSSSEVMGLKAYASIAD